MAVVDVLSPLSSGPGPLLMGIVNVTPDSLSDGGRFADPDAALARAEALAEAGAVLVIDRAALWRRGPASSTMSPLWGTRPWRRSYAITTPPPS